MFATKNASQKYLRKAVKLIRATQREEGSARPHERQAKRLTMTGDKILHNVIPMAKEPTT
eukprot:12517715-Ditylum_brightwellii.AAC.2